MQVILLSSPNRPARDEKPLAIEVTDVQSRKEGVTKGKA